MNFKIFHSFPLLLFHLLALGYIRLSWCTSITSYQIRDLERNDACFSYEADNWSASRMISSQIYTKCSNTYLLGGYNVLGQSSGQNGDSFSITYSGLTTHTMVYFEFTMWAIDTWDGNQDYFIVEVDSYSFTSWKNFDENNFPNNYCGDNGDKDLKDIKLFGRVAHTGSSLTFKVISKFDSRSEREAFGIRDLDIILASPSSAPPQLICGRASISIDPLKECSCPTGQYLSGSCTACHTSCSSCFGAGASNCYACKDGYTFDGTSCMACDSSCDTCYGTSNTQCKSCQSGYLLVQNTTCVATASCPSPLIKTGCNTYCDTPCANLNHFAYWNGSCFATCAVSLVQNTLLGVYKTCEFPCSGGQYLYWNGTCASSCNNPLDQRTEAGKNYCDYPCLAAQFLYWNGSCISTCASPLVSGINGGFNFCYYPCTGTQFLYWNGSCLSTCPSPLDQRTEATKKYCDYPCSNTQFLYWNGTCASNCLAPLTSGIEAGLKYCYYPCTGGQYLYWNGTCGSCNNPLDQRFEAGKNYCDYPCSTTQFLYWNGTCASTCQSPLTNENIGGYKFCYFPCTGSQYLYWNGSCLSTCATPLDQRSEGGKNFCDYPCLVSQFLYWNGTCASGCLSPLVSGVTGGLNYCYYPCTGSDFLYWNGSCLSTCNLPLTQKTEAGKKYCDYPCSATQYLDWDGTCSSACLPPLSSGTTAGLKYCYYPCLAGQFLYWNGDCSSSCNSPLSSRTAAGKTYCDFPCSSTQYLYWNGTCASTCLFPLTSGITSGRQFCYYPCSGGQYLYWNGTCAAACLSPLVTRTQAGKNYCDYPCSTLEYLYWNGTCSSICRSPLISRLIGTNQFCYYPCSGSNFLYWNSSCSATCNPPLTQRTEAGKKYCDYPCPTNQYLMWYGNCSSTCSSLYISKMESNRNFCSHPCPGTQYLYWDGLCSSTCGNFLAPSSLGGKNFCNSPCNSNEFLYWNGSCLTQCDMPVVRSYRSSVNFCSYPCNTGEYLYYNGSCITTCLAPFRPRKEAGKDYCDPICSNNFELLLNSSCIPSCGFPLFFSTNSTGTYCNLPCKNVSHYFHDDTGECNSQCNTSFVYQDRLYLRCFAPEPPVPLVKLLHHIRYLGINFPRKLENMTITQQMNVLSMRIIPEMIADTKRTVMQVIGLSSKIGRYDLPSSFLSNFLDDLILIAIILTVGLSFYILEKAFQRSKWLYPHLICERLRTLAIWNLPLVLIIASSGEIIFFTSIEFTSFQPSSLLANLSLVICIAMLAGVILILLGSLYMIFKIQNFRTQASNLETSNGYSDYLLKLESLQVLYRGFKETKFLTQSFYFIYGMRLSLPMVVASFLPKVPIVQSIFYVIISLAIIAFVAHQKPLKSTLDQVNLLILEVFVLIANISALVLTIFHLQEMELSDAHNVFAQVIIVMNYCIDYLAAVFLPIKLIAGVRVARLMKKTGSNEELATWVQLLFLPLQQGGFGFEQVQLVSAFNVSRIKSSNNIRIDQVAPNRIAPNPLSKPTSAGKVFSEKSQSLRTEPEPEEKVDVFISPMIEPEMRSSVQKKRRFNYVQPDFSLDSIQGYQETDDSLAFRLRNINDDTQEAPGKDLGNMRFELSRASRMYDIGGLDLSQISPFNVETTTGYDGKRGLRLE